VQPIDFAGNLRYAKHMNPSLSRRRPVLTLLVWSVFWFAWSVATTLNRAHTAAGASEDPYYWRFWTPEVQDLRAFAGEIGRRVPVRGEIAVVAAAGRDSDGNEVAAWCEFYLPDRECLWTGDLAPGHRPEWRLVWNQADGEAGWAVQARHGRFRLERRSGTP